MFRMITRTLVAAALALAVLGGATGAEAKQPPAKCKLLAVTYGTAWPGVQVPVYTYRCRGQVVTVGTTGPGTGEPSIGR